MDFALIQQLLAGGTPAILLVGIIIVGRLWLKDREIHKKERTKDKEEQLEAYRLLVQDIQTCQAEILEKVAAALDRNSTAFERLGNEERAAERQERIIALLQERPK